MRRGRFPIRGVEIPGRLRTLPRQERDSDAPAADLPEDAQDVVVGSITPVLAGQVERGRIRPVNHVRLERRRQVVTLGLVDLILQRTNGHAANATARHEPMGSVPEAATP